jgi:uncharacterized protein YbjQ (UPF0145 family)
MPIVLTTDDFPGRSIEPIGPVLAACCISKSLLGDVVANVKNWSVGGELRAYSDLLQRTAEAIVVRISEQADELKADAVIGFRMTSSSVTDGAAELIGYGTAVRFVAGA